MTSTGTGNLSIVHMLAVDFTNIMPATLSGTLKCIAK